MLFVHLGTRGNNQTRYKAVLSFPSTGQSHKPSTCAEQWLGSAGALCSWRPQHSSDRMSQSSCIAPAAAGTPQPLLSHTLSAKIWGSCCSCCCSGCHQQSVLWSTGLPAGDCVSVNLLLKQRVWLADWLKEDATQEVNYFYPFLKE